MENHQDTATYEELPKSLIDTIDQQLELHLKKIKAQLTSIRDSVSENSNEDIYDLPRKPGNNKNILTGKNDTMPKDQNLVCQNIMQFASFESSLSATPPDNKPFITESQNLRRPDIFKNRFQEFGFVLVGVIGQFLSQVGLTQVLSTMNILAEELHTTKMRQPWLMAAFPLGLGCTILISGRLGDIFGLKKVLLLGYIITTIWTLICGFSSYAHSDDLFIVSRTFQGLGLACALPNMFELIGIIYKPHCFKKNMIFCIIGAMSPIGATLGGIFAGLSVKYNIKNWPWSFYSFAIVAFLNGIIAWFCIPNDIEKNPQGLKMDWIGSALGLFGLVVLNFVFNQTPIDGWSSAYLIVLLVVSVVALILFVIYELTMANFPLIPKGIHSNYRLILILLTLFCGWGGFAIWTFYYFAFQLNLRHYSPLWASSSNFVLIISGTIYTIICCLAVQRMKPPILLFFSMLGFLGGNILFAVTPIHQTFFRNMFGSMFLFPLGMVFSFPSASMMTAETLPTHYKSMAGSLVNVAINYATSICVGMAGSANVNHNNHGQDLLHGFRAASYLAIGLSGFSVFLSGLYMIGSIWTDRNQKMKENKLINTDSESV
ncbi:hypothetical protein TBLA_0C01160 [Henningerozyma blattae CBS 6284]|uniref:Major facilitator superfamily (MFS) profile domain-containing protein n=1 Tax=Henningerozyma blattae (strain ATCC 34711 / CBS 6284 / DSM 70876 / NBRC 10599 / NRRL Y-10934 / UCD 77-7) TaxID=1071380 RepID=I2H0M9_HENB6|nr:hypothetical protein TBLA_0C01160 [Tetrapisispora blattae CBS 6284]CCH59931.1 hypothetical protein TBLA_0C01160 [Tetrapisispora blattae CBS 6284]